MAEGQLDRLSTSKSDSSIPSTEEHCVDALPTEIIAHLFVVGIEPGDGENEFSTGNDSDPYARALDTAREVAGVDVDVRRARTVQRCEPFLATDGWGSSCVRA